MIIPTMQNQGIDSVRVCGSVCSLTLVDVKVLFVVPSYFFVIYFVSLPGFTPANMSARSENEAKMKRNFHF
jgi:hypothetical protein